MAETVGQPDIPDLGQDDEDEYEETVDWAALARYDTWSIDSADERELAPIWYVDPKLFAQKRKAAAIWEGPNHVPIIFSRINFL